MERVERGRATRKKKETEGNFLLPHILLYSFSTSVAIQVPVTPAIPVIPISLGYSYHSLLSPLFYLLLLPLLHKSYVL